ncbi:MAG: phosphorylase [Chloroflexi bacterium 44-23]|nr:MAG: phosphorylase [Chloroflexi bacterium 44-23]
MTDLKMVDKSSQTKGQPQYHIRVKPGEVGKYVLLPGDPDRVLRIAKYLDNAHEVAFHREHRTWTGDYKGIRVSATSTGMGCPSAAIAVEELANVGATHFIRVGSTGALQKGMNIGDLVVSTGAMRLEGTTKYYAHDSFPATPDYFLTKALIEASIITQKNHAGKLFIGLSASSDAFYGETPELQRMVINHKVLNMEMESSAIYVIAHMRGLKSGMVCAVSGNLATGDVIYDRENTGLIQGWEDAIKAALEAIYLYETQGYDQISAQYQPDFDYAIRYFPKY